MYSIHIAVVLHAYCTYCVSYCSDYNDRKDMALALLAAARGGYIKIMRCILQKDELILRVVLPHYNNSVLVEAMTEGLSSLFEVCI